MDYSGKVNLSCTIQDIPCFILFGVEVFSRYSRTVLSKRYLDFYHIQSSLCIFSHCPFQQGKLLDVIPVLPDSVVFKELTAIEIEERTRDLSVYVSELLSLLSASTPSDKWTQLLKSFFSIDQIETKEHKTAMLIQNYYRRYKVHKEKRALQLLARKADNWTVSLGEIPEAIILEILSYFKTEELPRLGQIDKQFNELCKTPSLWRTLSLFNHKRPILPSSFINICIQASQLMVIDMRFCEFVTSYTLYSLSQFCNPSYFKELYVDGCEHIDNQGVNDLFSKFQDPYKLSMFSAKGGARGLTVLSLAECRKVTSQGLSKLRKLSSLKYLNLLGCVHINDEAVALVALGNHLLENLDLSGTAVSFISLAVIKENCRCIKRLSLNSCRNLSYTDSSVFDEIQIELNEDSVRFYLQPTEDSKLQKITNNVLRTRKSLSVYRISQFVQSKLGIESEVDIIFQGDCLPHFFRIDQLKFEESFLLLYRLRCESIEIEEEKKRNSWVGFRTEWVPDHQAAQCARCSGQFSFFCRKHHCRRCGKVVCALCSKQRRLIPNLGFTIDKVRVCDFCAYILKK